MTSPRFDFTHWPILGIYIPFDLAPESLPQFFREWESICVMRGKHVAVFDMRDFNPRLAFGPVRHIAAREVARGMDTYRGTLVGVVRLVAHPLTRALLTAFDWLVPLPWSVLNSECPVEGGAWLVAQARTQGLAAPARIDLDAIRARHAPTGVSMAS